MRCPILGCISCWQNLLRDRDVLVYKDVSVLCKPLKQTLIHGYGETSSFFTFNFNFVRVEKINTTVEFSHRKIHQLDMKTTRLRIINYAQYKSFHSTYAVWEESTVKFTAFVRLLLISQILSTFSNQLSELISSCKETGAFKSQPKRLLQHTHTVCTHLIQRGSNLRPIEQRWPNLRLYLQLRQTHQCSATQRWSPLQMLLHVLEHLFRLRECQTGKKRKKDTNPRGRKNQSSNPPDNITRLGWGKRASIER